MFPHQNDDTRTLADLEAAGFNGIGILCNRCAHATNLAIDGELRRRKGLRLEDLAKLLYCAACAMKRELVRHHDVTLREVAVRHYPGPVSDDPDDLSTRLIHGRPPG